MVHALLRGHTRRISSSCKFRECEPYSAVPERSREGKVRQSTRAEHEGIEMLVRIIAPFFTCCRQYGSLPIGKLNRCQSPMHSLGDRLVPICRVSGSNRQTVPMVSSLKTSFGNFNRSYLKCDSKKTLDGLVNRNAFHRTNRAFAPSSISTSAGRVVGESTSTKNGDILRNSMR